MLRRLVAHALAGDDMQELGTAQGAEIGHGGDQCVHVVAVDGPDVVEAQLLEQGARHDEPFNVLFGAAGACSLYINIVLWFTEKEYVYPTRGPLRYFTYYWGFFVYWGALALAYSAMRLSGVEL